MLVYKPGQYQALLLLERAGLFGSKTSTHSLLSASFSRRHPKLGLAIDPAVSEAAVRKIVAEQPIKALVFHRSPKDSTGKSLMLGEPVQEIEVRMTPPRKRVFSRQSLPAGSVTSDSLLGVLAPVLHAGQTLDGGVATLNEEGWQSALEVQMPSGTTRTVNVTRSDAITMSFPIGNGATAADRRSDVQFLDACQQAVEDLAARDAGRQVGDQSRMLGLAAGDGDMCQTVGTEWDADGSWEAVWGVDSSQRANP